MFGPNARDQLSVGQQCPCDLFSWTTAKKFAVSEISGSYFALKAKIPSSPGLMKLHLPRSRNFVGSLPSPVPKVVNGKVAEEFCGQNDTSCLFLVRDKRISSIFRKNCAIFKPRAPL